MEILAKPKARKVIEEKASQGLCIIPGCEKCFSTRGLCQTHASQFFRRLNAKRNDEERMQFENDAIREGYVLPVREQAKYRDNGNPFDRIAQ